MTWASNLKELMLIRKHNRVLLDRFNHNHGTALGFKYTKGQNTGHPAVIAYVPRKLDNR